MSDFDKWFSQYLLNKTDSCLDRDILRWAKPVLEVGFNMQQERIKQGKTLPLEFKGSQKYLLTEQKLAKATEAVEFYGDKAWECDYCFEHCKDEDFDCNGAGKFARQCKKEIEELG